MGAPVLAAVPWGETAEGAAVCGLDQVLPEIVAQASGAIWMGV